MKKKLWLLALPLLALVFYIGVSTYYKAKVAQESVELSKTRGDLFVRDYSPSMGPTMAKVTLVEFLDPECESCRVFHPVVKDIMKEHEGSVRLVIRFVPFHENSHHAIRVLEAARKQGKFWESLGIMFAEQPKWADHKHPKPELVFDFLPRVGVDVEQIKKDMMSPEITAAMKQDIEDARALGIRGTPTFFVNGRPLDSFGIEELRQAVALAVKE